ncbi:MAG: hypothetical protein ACR2PT_10525 [Endozoicomonas sp.]
MSDLLTVIADLRIKSAIGIKIAMPAFLSGSLKVCSLNLPFVLGHIPGLESPHIGALVAYASDALQNLPVFAPPGGTNHISSRSVARATLVALTEGKPGKAYLPGDESLSWKEYLEMWFEAAGNGRTIEVKDEDHTSRRNKLLSELSWLKIESYLKTANPTSVNPKDSPIIPPATVFSLALSAMSVSL